MSKAPVFSLRILLYLILAAAILSSVHAETSKSIPSAQVIDKSDRDLQELELLFSGGAQPGEDGLQPSVPPEAKSAYAQMYGYDPMLGLFDPPYMEFFQNDSLFLEYLNLTAQPPATIWGMNWSSFFMRSQESAVKRHVIS